MECNFLTKYEENVNLNSDVLAIDLFLWLVYNNFIIFMVVCFMFYAEKVKNECIQWIKDFFE